jgi:hypothetical protein
VGLERGPLSLGSTIEELHGRKSSGSDLENRDYGRRDPSRWPRGTSYPQTLAPTLPTSGSRSVGIVRSRIKATELFLLLLLHNISSRTTTLGLTQPLREMSSGNLPLGLIAVGAQGWQLHLHLWTHCLENVTSLKSHKSMCLHGLLQGQIYFYFLLTFMTGSWVRGPEFMVRVQTCNIHICLLEGSADLGGSTFLEPLLLDLTIERLKIAKSVLGTKDNERPAVKASALCCLGVVIFRLQQK